MDDDLDVGTGSHILASVSRVRVQQQKMQLPVPKPRGPRPLWGFTYTKFPKPGESKFVITDEVRFTALCLIIVGAVCVLGFMAADLGLNRIKVRDVLESGGHGLAVLIGGIFSALACILSYIQIRSHHANWTHPPSQREVVRILYMVPIYAISALLSLTFLNMSAYIDFVRGVYEAFVIYTFMILLTKYLGGHNGVVEWMKYKPPQPWPSPFCFLKPVVPDSTYLYYLKYGALQYTVLTPICSLSAVVLSSFDMFEEGVLEVDNGYPYIAFIMNVSQLVSLYCLVWLYVCVKNELAPFGPLAKFLVVKAVVFLTFWQGIALAFAVHFGWITKSDNFSVGEVQVGLQDFLLCIEMFLAACTHKYTFGSETYADGTLRLIMEQRALYLAEISYKRGVEAQKEALAALEAQGLLPASPHARVAEETAAERAARQEAMVEAIRREMDEDTGGDVLFDDDLVDWTSGALPSPTSAAAAAAGLPGASLAEATTKRAVTRASAYDYVYAYELELQRPEGVDVAEDEAPGAAGGGAADEDDPTEGGRRNGIGRGARNEYADEALPVGDEEVDFGYDRPASPSMAKPARAHQSQRAPTRNATQGRYQYEQAAGQYALQDEEFIFDEPAPVQQPARPQPQQQARAQPNRQQQRPQQQRGGPRPQAPSQGARRPPPPAAHVVDMDENPFD